MEQLLRYVTWCVFLGTSALSAAYSIEPVVRFPENPRITIITSVFKSDRFMRGFLEDITQQTIFNECELILINAHSPGNEEALIRDYMARYANITYVKLDEDPGLYAVWNIGIELARSEYVTNANTDDRLAYSCYSVHAQALDLDDAIDLVYSDYATTTKANETMKKNSAKKSSNHPEFEPVAMKKCLPGMNPMWRKSLHAKHGLFNEGFVSAGDWEMWCRAAEGGSLFKKVNAITGLYYMNPVGLSSSTHMKDIIEKERRLIGLLYSGLFGLDGKKKRVLATAQERTEKRSSKERRVKKTDT